MTVPQGLFVDSPEFADSSAHQMPDDIASWPEEIITKFKERIPSSEGSQMMVKFIKMDEETGTATGALLINTATKKCYAPIVVHDFSMSPLDVIIAGKKILPATQENFAQAMSDNNVFRGLEEYPNASGVGRFDEGNLWNTIYPPSLGRYSFASANAYPILSSIAGTFDGAKFASLIKSQPESLVSFQNNGHFELLKKVAASKAVQQTIAQNAPAINLVCKKAPGKYNIMQSSDKLFTPSEIQDLGRQKTLEIISKFSDKPMDFLNEVDENGEKMLIIPNDDTPAAPWIEGGISKNIVNVIEPGRYVVRRRDGLEIEGLAITDVRNIDYIPYGQSMFLGKNGMFGLSERMAGLRVDKSLFMPEEGQFKIGQTGVFVKFGDKCQHTAIAPLTIRSIANLGGDYKYTLKCSDLMGFEVVIHIPTNSKLIRPSKVGNAYVIPDCFRWIPVETLIELPTSVVDYATKEAAFKKTASPVKIIYNGYDKYSIRGLDKYAQAMGVDRTSMSGSHVKFLLSSLGGANIADEVIKTAQIRTLAVVHNLKELPLGSEKTASLDSARAKVAMYCDKLSSNLIKEASQMENSQSVDALLSLNFINPDNIQNFVAKIPSLKAAISNLASLLIASRLGIKEVPESAASTAMNRLVEVVNGLEALRASQEG